MQSEEVTASDGYDQWWPHGRGLTHWTSRWAHVAGTFTWSWSWPRWLGIADGMAPITGWLSHFRPPGSRIGEEVWAHCLQFAMAFESEIENWAAEATNWLISAFCQHKLLPTSSRNLCGPRKGYLQSIGASGRGTRANWEDPPYCPTHGDKSDGKQRDRNCINRRPSKPKKMCILQIFWKPIVFNLCVYKGKQKQSHRYCV